MTLLLLLACILPDVEKTAPPEPHTGVPQPDTDEADSGDTGETDSGGTDSGDSGETDSADTSDSEDSGSTRADEVCARWEADRADLSEGRWSGDANTCDAGDMAAAGRENALRLTNLYRWLAGQPAVDDDPTRNAAAQECALMQHRHGSLSHYPDASWACYTAAGAGAAGSSNIASAPAVYAVDMYMLDWGNETTIGHRRWLLSNQLGPVGIGSTDRYSCMWVLYGSGGGTADWVAWPPPGPFPIDAFFHGGSSSLDDTGWTVQSDRIDLSRGRVTVTSDGAELAVDVDQLLSGYGSTYALKITPRGWQAQAGRSYTVTVAGVSPEITYTIEVVDCR